MIYLKTSLGIEIREQNLLISCLQSNLSGGVFTHFMRVEDYRGRDRGEVRREIDTFFKSHRLARENIVLGIPRADTIFRHLDFPAEVADNLKHVMLYQVQTFEPTEEEKFYYDYVPLRSSPNGKRLAILLIMVKKSVLDGHLDALRELGVKPSCVTVGSVALANMLLHDPSAYDGKTFLLIDVMPERSEVSALRNGMLVYSQEASKETMNWKDFLLGEVEKAASRVRMSPDETIERILLAGDVSEDDYREMHEAVEDCELVDRRIRFETPLKLKPRLLEASSSLGLAYSGLVRRPAMKFNLLPADLRMHQTRWAYVPAIILGLAIAALLAGLGFRQMIQERSLIRELDEEILALQERVGRVQAIRAQAEDFEKRILFLEGLLRNRDMNLEVLRELTTILPPDTFISMYQNAEGSVQISGSSSSAPDLIPKLEQSPLLRSVVQRGTIFRDAQTGKDRFTFEAKVER